MTEYDGYQFEPGARCIIEQYDMLLRCSKKKDMTEWNEWRKGNPKVEIHLQGADLVRANLQGAQLWLANLQGADLSVASLQRARFHSANLRGADITRAKLQGANLPKSNLQGANLREANLQGADLTEANLQGAILLYTNLQGASLTLANLQAARAIAADLQGASLVRVNLQGADLSAAILRGTRFYMAAVNGETIIHSEARHIDKDTDFTGVGLDTARLEPALKQMFKYNIRRRRWRAWYKEGSPWVQRTKKAFIHPFWWMSDYGRSTGRIIGCFFTLAVIFAVVYLFVGVGCYLWSGGENTGMIANLFEKDGIAVPAWLVPWRALYFSIVTMTTLGFGDMYAAPGSLAGHLVLAVQVLLGYILLAALVTRFAVLFQAGGPAGQFARKSKD